MANEKRDHRKKGPMSPEEARVRGYEPYADPKMRIRDSAIYPFKISGYFGEYPLTVKERNAWEEEITKEVRHNRGDMYKKYIHKREEAEAKKALFNKNIDKEIRGYEAKIRKYAPSPINDNEKPE